jgi:hypothetical protein
MIMTSQRRGRTWLIRLEACLAAAVRCHRALASREDVERISVDGVGDAGAAVDSIAMPVANPDDVVPGAGRDRVPTAPTRHLVGEVARADVVVP